MCAATKMQHDCQLTSKNQQLQNSSNLTARRAGINYTNVASLIVDLSTNISANQLQHTNPASEGWTRCRSELHVHTYTPTFRVVGRNLLSALTSALLSGTGAVGACVRQMPVPTWQLCRSTQGAPPENTEPRSSQHQQASTHTSTELCNFIAS